MTISRKTLILITLVGLFCICVGKFLFPLYLWPSAPNSTCSILLKNLSCSIRWSFGDFFLPFVYFFKKQIIFFLQNANEAFFYSLAIIWISGCESFPFEVSAQLHTLVPKSPALAVLRSVLGDSCACWTIIIESYLCIFFLWVLFVWFVVVLLLF